MIFSGPVVNLYRKSMFSRVDGDGLVHYFSAEDFPGLL